jgi:hypothetical protein
MISVPWLVSSLALTACWGGGAEVPAVKCEIGRDDTALATVAQGDAQLTHDAPVHLSRRPVSGEMFTLTATVGGETVSVMLTAR